MTGLLEGIRWVIGRRIRAAPAGAQPGGLDPGVGYPTQGRDCVCRYIRGRSYNPAVVPDRKAPHQGADARFIPAGIFTGENSHSTAVEKTVGKHNSPATLAKIQEKGPSSWREGEELSNLRTV